MKYITSIFSTGAVRKTPEKIIKKIIAEIDPHQTKNIIEFGAGKGEITQPLIQHFDGNPINYYAFEIDEYFSSLLQKSSPEIHVVSEDAFDFEKSIPAGFKADCIISSMPLSFYTKPHLVHFLKKVLCRLNDNGKFLILFHAFWMIPFFKKQLAPIYIHRFNTIPLYFLLVFNKKKMKPVNVKC